MRFYTARRSGGGTTADDAEMCYGGGGEVRALEAIMPLVVVPQQHHRVGRQCSETDSVMK